MSTLEPRKPYQYTKLCNARVGSVVHVFGIVSYMGSLIPTRKGDHCLPITLVDESVDVSCGGLKCNIFAKEIDKLPPQNSVGKVLRLHRLNIGNYQQSPQGMGNCGRGKLSWVLFLRGLPEQRPVSCTKNYTCTVSEIRRCEELYVWWDLLEAADRKRKRATAGSAFSKLALMQDLWPSGSCHDFLVQVIGIYIFPGESSAAMLRVWDGTRCRYKSCHVVPHMLDTAQAKTTTVAIPERYLVDVYAFGNHVLQALELKTFDFVHLRDVTVKPLSAQVKETVESHCAYRFQEPYMEYMQFLLHAGIQADRGIFLCSAASQEGVRLRKRLKDVLEAEFPEDVTVTEEMQHLLQSVSGTPSDNVEKAFSGFSSNVRTSSATKESDAKETQGGRTHNATPPAKLDLAVGLDVDSKTGQQQPSVQTNSVKEAMGSAEELVIRLLRKEKVDTIKMSLISELRPSADGQHLLAQVLECQVSSLGKYLAILTVWDGTPISYAFQGIFLPDAVTIFRSEDANHQQLDKRCKLPVCIVGKESLRVRELKPHDIVRFTNLRIMLTREKKSDFSLKIHHSFQAYCLLGEEKGSCNPEVSIVNVDSPAALSLIARLQSMRGQAKNRGESEKGTEGSAENKAAASLDKLMETASRQQGENPNSHFSDGELERTCASQAITKTPKMKQSTPQRMQLAVVDPPWPKSIKKNKTEARSPKPGPSGA